MKELLVQVQPALLELFSAIITFAITMVAFKVRQKFNVDIEEKYKKDLHDAAMTAARVVVAKFGPNLDMQITAQPVEHVLDHMQNSVSDAIKVLEPSAGVLSQIAVAKIEVAKNERRANDAQASSSTAPASGPARL